MAIGRIEVHLEREDKCAAVPFLQVKLFFVCEELNFTSTLKPLYTSEVF